MTAPAGYPLPWCDALDAPYWVVNVWLCGHAPGWRERQAHRPMSEIIPWIDDLIDSGAIARREKHDV